MNEELPWQKFGITEDRLYTIDAADYWRQQPIDQLWEHILNVGGSYLANIRRFATIVDRRLADDKIQMQPRKTNREYLAAILDRTERLEEMLVLMTSRLRVEGSYPDTSSNKTDNAP